MNNKDRADRIEKAILSEYSDVAEQEDMETVISDALTDLIHLMKRENIIPLNMFIHCQDSWIIEVNEDKELADIEPRMSNPYIEADIKPSTSKYGTRPERDWEEEAKDLPIDILNELTRKD